jgi:PAS domain S-box-containing protein
MPSQIMVVEDESIVALGLQYTLERLGYQVPEVVSSGEEAVERAMQLHPDLVLMDISLEGEMDGVEAARHIHLEHHIPVVYLTAFSGAQILERAKVTEPFGYLIKPFEEQTLRSTIEIALYKHRAEEELRQARLELERQVVEATAELRTTTERLAVTLRSIGEGVVAADSAGRVVLINRVAEDLTGWPRVEAEGRLLTEVFSPVDERSHLPDHDVMQAVLGAGRAIERQRQLLLLGRDGTTRPIASSSAPIRDDQGSVMGVVVVFRDVSSERRTQQELLRTAKLDSLGVLAGGIAHDFNNILTAIMGHLSLARSSMGPTNNLRGTLEEIENASQRAADLTRQLLAFAKGGAPVKRAASMPELIRDCAVFVLRGSDVGCEWDLAEELWPAEVDVGQVCQVIQNLVLNADQAMPNGGVVRIWAANVLVEAAAGLPLAPGRYLEIGVGDTGVGIPEEHLSRIFDPYFTTKEGGSGLGLATAYAIARNHDGHIVVDSRVGTGSTFRVYLPAAAAAPVGGGGYVEQALYLGRGRVLVMDDQAPVRQVLGEMLVRLGYEAEFANDGQQALELYRRALENARPFAAAIMDLTIPGGMGGKEAVGRLRQLDPAARVVVSSGYSDDPVLANFREYGFDEMVGKPYRLHDLSLALHRVLKNTEPGA